MGKTVAKSFRKLVNKNRNGKEPEKMFGVLVGVKMNAEDVDVFDERPDLITEDWFYGG